MGAYGLPWKSPMNFSGQLVEQAHAHGVSTGKLSLWPLGFDVWRSNSDFSWVRRCAIFPLCFRPVEPQPPSNLRGSSALLGVGHYWGTCSLDILSPPRNRGHKFSFPVETPCAYDCSYQPDSQIWEFYPIIPFLLSPMYKWNDISILFCCTIRVAATYLIGYNYIGCNIMIVKVIY